MMIFGIAEKWKQPDSYTIDPQCTELSYHGSISKNNLEQSKLFGRINTGKQNPCCYKAKYNTYIDVYCTFNRLFYNDSQEDCDFCSMQK